MSQERDDETREHVGDVLREVVTEVGMTFGLSIAARADLCAERLFATGDADAIVYMLAEGWERELSREFTRLRKVVREATNGLHDADANDEARHAQRVRQLAFPIVVPGAPPTPLARATHDLIVLALESERRQLAGRQRNVAKLERYAVATEPWPDRMVADLLAAGLVTDDQLFGKASA